MHPGAGSWHSSLAACSRKDFNGKIYCGVKRNWYCKLQGYCRDGHCRRFPVLIGEIGSRLRDCRNPCNNREPTCMVSELQVNFLAQCGRKTFRG
jgi:hypothetical protein